MKLFEGLGIRFSDRFADDSEQMRTAIKGSSEVSVKRGSRFEKCPTDFSGFRDIDPLERLVPDVEKMPHQSENVLAGQQVDRLSAADGAGTGASTSFPLRKPTPGDDLKNGLVFDGDGGSARAAEGALIDQILSGHKELFMDLIRPHQRTVYAMVFSLLANKEDAEDVAQDTLVKALVRLHQFRRESTFGTWLIQIAINEARVRNRKQWRVPMMSLTRNKDKFFDECRVVRLPVRIEQIQSVWKTFLSGLPKDAANGRNPDATREKHRRPGEISMQRERSPGTADDELRAKSRRLQRGLKGSLPHAHRDHDRPFVMRRAHE